MMLDSKDPARAWKIRIGEVFRVPQVKVSSESSKIRSYLELTKGTCAVGADLQKGMFFYASSGEPSQKFERLPAFIFHSNPYKKDTEGNSLDRCCGTGCRIRAVSR